MVDVLNKKKNTQKKRSFAALSELSVMHLLIFTPRLYSQIDLHIKVRGRKAFGLIGKKKIGKK